VRELVIVNHVLIDYILEMRQIKSPFARFAVVLVAVIGLLAITTPAGASIDNLTIIPSPSPGADYNYLKSVSCVSESWCVAVGETEDGTMVLLWDGTVWAQMTSPNPANGTQVLLNEVSCVSESFCVAVGNYDLSGSQTTFVLSWDGTNWTQATSPSPGDVANHLTSVSCVSASWCIAVGEFDGTSILGFPLVLLWDGSAWTQSSVPGSGTIDPVEMNSVSCVSTSSCTAVGFYAEQFVGHHTTVLSWDGASWSIVPSPDFGDNNNDLNSVSCVSASSCVAVGFYVEDAAIWRPLVLSWNGVVWTTVTSPSPGEGDNVLDSVSCVSASSCVAVGNSGFSAYTFVLSWDGSAWTTIPSPNVNPDNPGDYLASVSCVNSSWCVSVGGSAGLTLIVGMAGTPDTPVDPAAPVAPAFTG